MNELRIAIRQHLRQLPFALTVVVTLGVSIGATTAVFSVVDAVLLRALPFAASERLVWIASVRPDNPNAPFSLPEFTDYRSHTHTLAGLAAYANWNVSLVEDQGTEKLTGARMSANAFDVLGISPVAGRLLLDSDDKPDAPLAVVLSYRLWQRQFGGTAEAIGKTARINGESYVVIGVLPKRFPIPLLDIDAVTALAPDRDPLRNVRNSVNFLRFFGRLGSDTEASQAQSELTAICASLRQQFPAEYARKEAVKVIPLLEALVADFRQSMLVLFGAVIVVLAAALANLMSLALVRANGRWPELSIRVAMGASRLRLARQLAIEASLLAISGALLGWSVTAQVIAATKRIAPPSIRRLNEVELDFSVALFVAAITVAATVLLTATPLGAIARLRASDALRSATRGAIGDRWNRRVRHVMVIAEISAALVLCMATIVLLENLLQLQNVRLGFDPDSVFQARVAVPSTYHSREDVARFYERLSDRLDAAPGVSQVGVVSVAPLSGLLLTVPFAVADRPFAERNRPSANLRAISPGYLQAVGTRLVKGRAFSEDDRFDAPPVALVSAELADRFMTGGAIGRRLVIDDNNKGPRALEVVGVVENVRQIGLDLPPALDIYIPLRQIHPDQLARFRDNQFWMVRTLSDPAAFRETFLSQLRAVDADAAVSGVGTMRQYVDAWLGPRQFNLALVAAFAMTAVLLAVSGIYGLVSYTVGQQRREIGVRMAIGATAGNVQRMILSQALTLGAVGALAGLGLATALRRLIAGIVQDVSMNPLIVAATLLSLVAVVLMAAWLPARRASRIDPAVALRAQ